MENEGPPIPRKGVQRTAGGGNDDMVQGEDETASPSDNSVGAAIGGRRQTPSFNPERHLLVEDEPDALDAFLDAATTEGVPVSIPVKRVIVESCQVRVVALRPQPPAPPC
jgi:hypothetical protein